MRPASVSSMTTTPALPERQPRPTPRDSTPVRRPGSPRHPRSNRRGRRRTAAGEHRAPVVPGTRRPAGRPERAVRRRRAEVRRRERRPHRPAPGRDAGAGRAVHVRWSNIRAADAKPPDAGPAGTRQMVERAIPTLVADVSRRVATPSGPCCSPTPHRWRATATSASSHVDRPRQRDSGRSGWSCPSSAPATARSSTGRRFRSTPPASSSPPSGWADNQANAMDPTLTLEHPHDGRPHLTADLKARVLTLEADLRDRLEADADQAPWQTEHRDAVEADRTAAAWVAFRDDRITQAAVAWVLTSVFVRFCEDNALVRPVWIAGPRAGRKHWTPRSPTSASTRSTPTASGSSRSSHLAGCRPPPGSSATTPPSWQVEPSGPGVTGLSTSGGTDDHGAPGPRPHRPGLSTRFLGDLYQDLSEHARKPTRCCRRRSSSRSSSSTGPWSPPSTERPLEGSPSSTRPAAPATSCSARSSACSTAGASASRTWTSETRRQHRALDAVYGVDINPFAVAIARFRLIVAALRACGLTSLEDAPDSRSTSPPVTRCCTGATRPTDGPRRRFDADAAASGFTYDDEDLATAAAHPAARPVRRRRRQPALHHRQGQDAQPGLPRALRLLQGTYALTVPFMERFFDLARPGGTTPGRVDRADHLQLVHEAGVRSKIIEEFLVAGTCGSSSTHRVPTSPATARPPSSSSAATTAGRSTVRAVLGVRGEPGRPGEPEKGWCGAPSPTMSRILATTVNGSASLIS